MYINKLHIKAFGKFIHKMLYFENNFNIIYGENEAGKSTVHNFIEAVLYDFDDNESGRLKYNKYKPWNSNLYKGSIGVNDDAGEKHVITKDFLLGSTQVFKKLEDGTEMYEDKIQSPGEYFFNMSKASFINTVSIKQLGNKTEKEVASELKNKIINLSKTKDESISVDRILQSLNYVKEEAGDENNRNTLLGQYTLRLKELKNTRENSLNGRRQVMFLAMEKKKISGKIQELNLHIEELNNELRNYELSVEKDKYLRAEPVKKELDEINEKLSSYSEDNIKKYSDIDYVEALNIENNLNTIYSQRCKTEDSIKEKEKELNTLLSDVANKIKEEFNIEKLNKDYAAYEDNALKIDKLKDKIRLEKENISNIDIDHINNFLNSYSRAEDINRKIEFTNIFLDNEDCEKMKSYRSRLIRNATFILLSAVALIGGVWLAGFSYADVIDNFVGRYYAINNPSNAAAGIMTVIIAIILALIEIPVFNRIKNSKNEIDGIECELADFSISLDEFNEEKLGIIKDVGCKNFEEASEKYRKLIAEKNQYEEKDKLINCDVETLDDLEQENKQLQESLLKILSTLDIRELNAESVKEANDAYARRNSVKEESNKLKSEIEQFGESIVKLDKDASFEKKRLEMILKRNDMDDLDTFKKAVEYSKKYKELLDSKKYKESILQKITEGESFQELKDKTKNVNLYEVKNIDKQEHQISIFKLNGEKSELSKKIDNILQEIDEIERNTRNSNEVEEEIDFYENKIDKFKKKIKVAEIASEKIKKISDSIMGDFMPLLRKSISDNFSYLTGGRYCQVAMDEDMNITVVEKDNKEKNIELESLSGGTLDQLYLSLRVALGNILSGNQNIPLIFDDSFVQYDSKRLKNSMEMLAKESERRQIILFTCQEREAELAKKTNIKFNYIKL